jgi:hypothetical protein
MDTQIVDQNWSVLQQQAQQTARQFETLAGKLQAAAAAGNQNAREWLLDLKEIALSVHQEESQASQLMQSVHQLVDNHMNQGQFAPPPPPQPTFQQPAYQQQPVYQQPVYQQPVYGQPMYAQPVYQQPYYGGGYGGFMGGGFGQAMAAGAGFAIGEEIIEDIF